MEAGELVPQTTLNRFEREDEEWTLAEKIKIAAKVKIQSKSHCSQCIMGIIRKCSMVATDENKYRS